MEGDVGFEHEYFLLEGVDDFLLLADDSLEVDGIQGGRGTTGQLPYFGVEADSGGLHDREL